MVQSKTFVVNDSDAVFELTEEERQEMFTLAKQLIGSGERLIDDFNWLSLACEKSAWLPRRIMSVLRKFRNDPGSSGYLLFQNVPVAGDAPLPDTPCIADSVERKATIPTSAIVLFSLSLGEMISYRAEKSGALIQNVVPVPGYEDTQTHAGSVLLEMHTENAYLEHFPDYVSLLCVREDVTGDAQFCVSSLRDALPLLSPDTIQVLYEPIFSSRPPRPFISVKNLRSHAVLSGDIEDPNLSVDFADTIALDRRGDSALDELREALMKTMNYYQLKVGDLVIVDNRVTVHGRTPYVPSYDGTDRWLQRIFTHLDNRRTRVARKNNGHVLD